MTKLGFVCVALATLASGLVACGDDGGGGNHPDAAHGTDAAAGTALTVKNIESWCSVTVGSGSASTLASQTVNVAPGTINVAAVALDGFKLGTTPWHDTAGDTSGSGEQGTLSGSGQAQASATTVVVGATAKCVWVCCPFENGTGCDVDDPCQ